MSRALAEPAIPARTDRATKADTIVFMARTPDAIRTTPLLTVIACGISAASQLRLCCKAQLGFSVVQPGIKRSSPRSSGGAAQCALLRLTLDAARSWPVLRPAFIPPCEPTLRDRLPKGEGWFYEVKHDGYRLQAHKADREVTLYTRSGANWTERFAHVAASLASLACRSAIIDAELVHPGANRHPCNFACPAQVPISANSISSRSSTRALSRSSLTEVEVRDRERCSFASLRLRSARRRVTSSISSSVVHLMGIACSTSSGTIGSTSCADGPATNGEEEPGHRDGLLVGGTERTQYQNAIPQF